MNKFLDRYSMMIVSKYFVCLNDFKNLILVCKKFNEIPLMFHFNPIQWKPKMKKYFKNVETLHLYSRHDKFVPGFYQYYVHYPTELTKSKKLNKKMKVICPHITFSSRDLQNGFSYKEASILLPNAFGSKLNIFTELECSNISKLSVRTFTNNKMLNLITLSNHIQTIPDLCFEGCASLKEINLEHVSEFGTKCFIGCDSLSAITFCSNLKKCGRYPFYDVLSIQHVTASSSNTKSVELELNASCSSVFSNIRKTLFITQSDVGRGFSIDCEVTEICEAAFLGMKNLSDKSIAPTIKIIRKNAFSYSDLKVLDLSNVEVFEEQENLKTLTALTMNSTITFNNLYRCNSLQSIEVVGTKFVKGKAACWMKTLFDKKNIEVEEYMYSCKDCELFNGILPFNITNLKTIEKDVRLKDLEIETYKVPDSVTTIYAENFRMCKNIKKLLLPKCLQTSFNFTSLTTIKEAALPYITNNKYNIYSSGQLTSITFLDDDMLNNKRINESKFKNLKNIEFAHLPKNNIYCKNVDYNFYNLLKTKYKIEGDVVLYYLENWNYEKGIYIIPDEVTIVNSYVLYNNDNLKEIWVGRNTKLIKEYAFCDCKNLVLVKNLKKSMTIEKFAFGKSNPKLEFDDNNPVKKAEKLMF
ncbi:hypothetical protein EIN_425810 [Entamoeba invadens IP1]|uniref:Leucine rich repeat containing protein BspA family protein n=1 Tax=Entamoeba invadens IP1 TaxID=370355 RepID=A0A0A1UBZ5_ENTIV|nr:hypothetical protein EIN_425810 [Entamoeba invadens IP1]ELP89819.1 hypothetical protein EIN_425810 [Entamoeba invadens IP1]|eukprot:XP_004256590.1 hypothetical protein EIN_425810 [Entamoeba invadens IP1]